MKYSLLLIGLLTVGTATAQSVRDIDTKILSTIQSSYKKDAATKAAHNAILSNKSLKALAMNGEIGSEIDHNFKYKVGVNGITDQLSSGRCWMFTSMNVFRQGVAQKYNVSSFDFSHNYNYFWDIFEKSNLFLENIISTAKRDMDDREVVSYFSSPIDDGGVWNHFYNVSKKYGVVPKSIMPETEHSNNTAQLLSVLKERLRKGGYDIRTAAEAKKNDKHLREIKVEVMKDVYRTLALCLGEPPVTFSWRYTDKNGKLVSLDNITPQQFFKDIVPAHYSPENYIMIMNDPTREYYKIYSIKNYQNATDGINWCYLNLPNEDIKAAALISLKNNEPMYASCDVGKQSDYKRGYMATNMYDYESLLGIDLKMDKKARILTRQSGSAHAMNLVACDTDSNDKPVKWQFENSWGADNGYRGFLTFTDEWFNEYMFRIVIKKEFLDSKAKESLKSNPIELPVWDYMF